MAYLILMQVSSRLWLKQTVNDAPKCLCRSDSLTPVHFIVPNVPVSSAEPSSNVSNVVNSISGSFSNTESFSSVVASDHAAEIPTYVPFQDVPSPPHSSPNESSNSSDVPMPD